MELKSIEKAIEGEQTNCFEEKIVHPMSGYNGSYDFCKFLGETIKKDNGKFIVQLTETVYHGDEEDEWRESESDISDVYISATDEFDTEEEADAFLDTIELEYEGSDELE